MDGVDHFGFVAESIGSGTIDDSSQKIPVPGGFTPISASGCDLTIHVVPAA